MPMKTIGASMSGNSSVWSRISAAMPNTASAIVTTTVMIGRRIAKSEMNMMPNSTAETDVRWVVSGEWWVAANAVRNAFTHASPPITHHPSQYRPQHVHEPRHVSFIVVEVRRHADRVAAHAHEHPRRGEALGETAGQPARQLHADDVR